MIAAAILIMVPGFAACAQEEEAGLQNTSISQTSIQDDSGAMDPGSPMTRLHHPSWIC